VINVKWCYVNITFEKKWKENISGCNFIYLRLVTIKHLSLYSIISRARIRSHRRQLQSIRGRFPPNILSLLGIGKASQYISVVQFYIMTKEWRLLGLTVHQKQSGGRAHQAIWKSILSVDFLVPLSVALYKYLLLLNYSSHSQLVRVTWKKSLGTFMLSGREVITLATDPILRYWRRFLVLCRTLSVAEPRFSSTKMVQFRLECDWLFSWTGWLVVVSDVRDSRGKCCYWLFTKNAPNVGRLAEPF